MRLLLTVVLAALIVVSVADAGDFKLQRVAHDSKTITLGWKRQPGADGYQFTRNGVVVSRTFDRSTTRATFWKGTRYGVQVLDRVAGGKVRVLTRATFTAAKPRPASKQAGKLVFVAARKPEFRLRLISQTAKTVTFGWKRQPGIDGFQFVRNGVVISRTYNRQATSATFWKGSRYAVDLLRVKNGKNVKLVRRALAVASKPTGRQQFVFLSAPTREFKLRVVAETSKTITFGWKRQPGADGFQFVRNGAIISRTFKRSTTTATFWKGSHYAVETVRLTSDKKVTRVFRALAYTNASAGSSKTTAPSGGGAKTPGSGAGSGGPGAPSAPPPSSSPSPAPPPSAGSSTPKPTPPAPPSPSPPPPPPPAPSSPPAPPSVGPGGTLMLSGSYSPDAFFGAIALAPPGPVRVTGNYTITGNIEVGRGALRIEGATIQGSITFNPGATGSSLAGSSALSFGIVGADNVLLEGNSFDGQCRVAQNWIQPSGGDGSRGFVIRGNTLRNYHVCADESVHSEAIFIAARSEGGLIEGNTFVDNGTTGHLFFSWFGGDPGSDYPRDICVRGNTFIRSLGYYHIQYRDEIPASSGIRVEPPPSNSIDGSAGLGASRFLGPC